MHRLGLNLQKRDNFMFFDDEAPLCLNLQKPLGVVEKLTPNILRGIKSGALLDIDEIEKGRQLQLLKQQEEYNQLRKLEEEKLKLAEQEKLKLEEQVGELDEVKSEEPIIEKPSKGGKRKDKK